jgi:hypothetical protein
MPATYKVGGLTLVFNDEDPQKTKESVSNLIQSLSAKIDIKNEYLKNQVNILKEYNKLTELCIETRKLQNAAMQASKDNNGPLLQENFINARAKFKEVQAQVKSIQAVGLDKIPPLTDELKASLGSGLAKEEEFNKILLETKKSGETLYKKTAVSSNEMIKHVAHLQQLGEDLASGKIKPSAQVHPAPAASASPVPLRAPTGLPSAYDAKHLESKAKADNANKIGGAETKPAVQKR